jgi:hypothetical protein
MKAFAWSPARSDAPEGKRQKEAIITRLLATHAVFHHSIIQPVCNAAKAPLAVFHRRTMTTSQTEKTGMCSGKRLRDSLPVGIVNKLRKAFAQEQRREINLENRAAWVYWKDLSGVAYSQLQTLGEVLSNLRPGMRQLVCTSNLMTSIADKFLLVRPTSATADGHGVSAIRLLQFVLPGLIENNKEAFQQDEVLLSLTGDGFEARGAAGKRTFTSMMFGILQNGATSMWQSPHWKFVVTEWAGSDNRANIQKHCTRLFDEVKHLTSMEAGIPVYVKGKDGKEIRYIKPHIIFCSDLKFRWEVMGCGGAHDPKFCDCCQIHRDQRRHVYTTYCTKEGDTVQSIADEHDIPIPMLYDINNPDAASQNEHAAYTRGEYAVNACLSHPAQSKASSRDAASCEPPTCLEHHLMPTSSAEPLPAGVCIRVWKTWCMDRNKAKALLPIPHIDSPFCWLHCMVRLTEHLLTAVLERAIQQKGSSVAMLNQNMERHKLAFRAAMEQDTHGSKKGQDLGGGLKLAEYKAVKLSGTCAFALAENVVTYGENSWLEGIDTRESTLRLWRLWYVLCVIGKKLHPTEADIDFFARYSKDFHRRCIHLMPDYVCNAYYFHYLSGHGGQYMRHWKSLGRFMQEGVEGRHKVSKCGYRHTTGGGAGGTTRGCKNEDGSRDVVRSLRGKHPTLMQMERNCRMLLYRFYNYNCPELHSCTEWQDAVDGGFEEMNEDDRHAIGRDVQDLLDACKITCKPRLAVSKERMGLKSICRYKASRPGIIEVVAGILPDDGMPADPPSASSETSDNVLSQRIADAVHECQRNNRKQKHVAPRPTMVPEGISAAAQRLYHECQELQFCFMHAFNMFMGFQAITPTAILKYLSDREKKVPSIATAYHKVNGFFNVVSMNAFLQGKGVPLESDASKRTLCYLHNIGQLHKGMGEDAVVRAMANHEKVLLTWGASDAPAQAPWLGMGHAAVLRRLEKSSFYFLQDSMLPSKVAFMGYDLKWEDLSGSMHVMKRGRLPKKVDCGSIDDDEVHMDTGKMSSTTIGRPASLPSTSLTAGQPVRHPAASQSASQSACQLTSLPAQPASQPASQTASRAPGQAASHAKKGTGKGKRQATAAFHNEVQLGLGTDQSSQPAKRRKK